MSAKQCEKCGNRDLVLIRTQSIKGCVDCGAIIPWRLDDGQRPVIEGGRCEPPNELGLIDMNDNSGSAGR